MLSLDDKFEITQLINLYGHIIDQREWDRLEELFIDDAVFDSSDLGNEVTHGLDALRARWKSSTRHPLAHHATNIVIWEAPDGIVHAQSKGIGVGFKGRTGTLTYKDVLRRTPAGWRIVQRTAIIMRAQPRPEA
jgi:hypothetical protein